MIRKEFATAGTEPRTFWLNGSHAGSHGELEMWFSFRSGAGEKYRIGYAACDDGRNWAMHLDDAGISVSERGWDSEMIEYPFVFDHGGCRYMV